MLAPFFIPVENMTGLVVSQEVLQLIDYVATCKQPWFQASLWRRSLYVAIPR